MNDITALRGHLFETLAELRDKDKPMDIDRAKAISDISQVIINSAKVEVDYAKVTGARAGSGFLAAAEMPAPQLVGKASSPTPTGVKTVEQQNGATVTTHKLR